MAICKKGSRLRFTNSSVAVSRHNKRQRSDRVFLFYIFFYVIVLFSFYFLHFSFFSSTIILPIPSSSSSSLTTTSPLQLIFHDVLPCLYALLGFCLLLVVSESYFHGKWAHWFLLCGCVWMSSTSFRLRLVSSLSLSLTLFFFYRLLYFKMSKLPQMGGRQLTGSWMESETNQCHYWFTATAFNQKKRTEK